MILFIPFRGNVHIASMNTPSERLWLKMVIIACLLLIISAVLSYVYNTYWILIWAIIAGVVMNIVMLCICLRELYRMNLKQ